MTDAPLAASTTDEAVESKFAAAVATAVVEALAKLPKDAKVAPPSNVPLILKYFGAFGLCGSGLVLVLHGDITGMVYVAVVLAPALSALGIHSALTSAKA